MHNAARFTMPVFIVSLCELTPSVSKNLLHKILHSGEGRSMKKLQFCLVFVCVLILALGAIAQIQNGQFTGTVTDPSGAAISDAKVIVTNTGTNLTVTATTNQTGLFVVRELPVGVYRLTAEAKGFKTVTD